jgi:biotin-(acetyl-CoA carboxylase) ligase
LGKNVIVKTRNGDVLGAAVDVDDECRLLIKLNSGKSMKIIEGDISVIVKATNN